MKTTLAFALALSCLAFTALADGLDTYRETVTQISAWTNETGHIKYKGKNKALQEYANAHNTAVKTIEKENAKIKQANANYSKQTGFNDPNCSIRVNKAIVFGSGRDAIVAKERIKRNDTIKRAEMGIKSANRKRIESQKLTLMSVKRKLKSEKPADESEQSEKEALIAQIDELIDALTPEE